MAASIVSRAPSSRGRRSFRKRRDSEEENVCLDLNKDPPELLQEILSHVVKRDVSKGRKLGYLNGLVKLCNKLTGTEDLGLSYREIFCCLRISFFHDSSEVRAAGLRAFRYLLRTNEALEAFIQMQLPLLVSRSLDLLLDNRIERIQALRLMRKVLCINPNKFPRAFTYCLVSIANEGTQERDMVRSCVATLAQLSLLNPEACAEANVVSVLLRSVFDSHQPNITESILGVIVYLFNNPKTRDLIRDDFGLEHLLAPFTDCHYRYPSDIYENSSNDDRDTKLEFSKLAIVAVLRTWSGVTYMCQPDHSHLHSLVQMLYLPYSCIQKNIIDLLYEIFNVPVPEWTSDFSVAIHSADPSAVQNSWELYKDFIVGEGTAILPYLSKDRMNLVQNYFALLLLVFLQAGVLAALAEVIISSEIHLAVRATILLGEFLYLANQLLPLDCSHHCNCLPSLISAAASFSSLQGQNQASAAVSCLYRIHELKQRGPIPHSLILAHVLNLCNPERKKKTYFGGTVSRNKLWHLLRKDIADMTDQAVKDTQVLSKEFTNWDWELISAVLKGPNDALKRLEDANYRSFVKKLVQFFKPSCKQFSEMGLDKERGPLICSTGCHLLEFLLEIEEAKSHEYMDDFLSDLNSCLTQVTKDSPPLKACLSPTKVLNTFCHAYFLFIGKLSSSSKGCKILNASGTFQNLLQLVTITKQDTFIKLIVSSLDYSKEGFSRAILNKVLTGSFESARLYATNYLRILLRAELADFRKWAIEYLVTQLYDQSKVVSSAAVDILDEACNIQENLEALISLRPSLLHLGDKGLLLLLRFLSVPSGFRFLRDANFLHHEIQRWKKVYNLKYVKIVEDALNEALSRHRRGEDGTYGRRSSDTRHIVQDVFLPHHMYGQLVQHSDGLDLLISEICLPDLFDVICSPNYTSELHVLQLKAALWDVGHIGSYALGFPIIQDADIIPLVIQLAAEAPVLTVRGTCFFVLGLLSSTPEGAETLAELGWETVQRTHDDKWPLVKESLLEDFYIFSRRHKGSVSSTSSEWPLGGLPFSLSFSVRSPDRPLITSHSSRSLNTDEVECSGLSVDTPEVGSAPTEQSVKPPTTNYRQRSSSDCQPLWTKNKPDGLPVEDQNWTVNKDRSSSFCCSQDSNGIILKERSASSGEMTESRGKSERASSAESSDTGGTKSRSDTASSASGGNFNDIKPFFFEQAKNLSPIASSTSINPSSKSSGDSVQRPSLLRQLSHSQSCYLNSPLTPEGNAVFTFTTAQDARGYIALKDIQRRRVQSLSYHGSHSYEMDEDLKHSKSQSLKHSREASFDSSALDFEFDGETSLQRSASRVSENSCPITIDLGDNDQKNIRFTGLCLPATFSMIFYVPKKEINREDIPDQSVPCQSEDLNLGLEFHSVSCCLASHTTHCKTGLLRETIDEELEDSFGFPLADSDEKTDVIVETKLLSGCNSKNSDHNFKGTPKLNEESPEWKLLVRKEVMRFVTNLSSTLIIKQSEQGLLNLKQKFPSAFQDVCLYTEISLHMANYHFRIGARRFLQELFLDATFEELQKEAESIIGVVTLPQLGGSEA